MIIVTGASGGIGSRLVAGLAGSDDVIVGTYHTRRPDLLDSTAQLYQVDVADAASVRQFAETVAPLASRITLVNLAGLSISGLAVDLDPADWDRVFAVNVRGSFLMSQAFLKPMIRDRWGRIVNVSSVVAREGVVGTAAYAAAKAGIEGLTRSLAVEYARYGVLVNTLSLGYFDAGLTHTLTDDQRQAVLRRVPLRRFGDVADLVEAVRYLMRASYITGETIRIDGGLP